MDSKIKLLGHPVHQMLVVFPLGLLATAVVFDLIHAVGGDETMAVVAFWLISAGLIGGVIAAPFGTIDWLSIPRGTRAKSVGAMHGAANLLVLILFLGSWALRREAPTDPGAVALLLTLGGGSVATIAAWLGGELVDRLGVGVHDGAHLDAPSSLSKHTVR